MSSDLLFRLTWVSRSLLRCLSEYLCPCISG